MFSHAEFTGGFGSYLLSMNAKIAATSTEANDAQNIKDPQLGWIIGFLFLVSFIGLFGLVPLRKIMIVDYKLTYPSGTATAYLINGFHTPQGAKLARLPGKNMLCVLSLMTQFCFELLNSVTVLQVFIAIALILGDGIYNVLKISILTVISLRSQRKKSNAATLPISEDGIVETTPVSYDEERRNEMFLKDQIPWYVALGGYVVIAAISIGTVPQIFPQLKWYHILVAYIFAPLLAFCNAYGSGLTDWSLVTTYGKLAIFAFGAWVGASHGGVLAGLAACGVMMNIVGTAADLMGDFKTGYLTLASPRSMFISQVIGTAMGCVISPCVFWLFYKAFGNIGVDGSEYPAPNAAVFRSMAILGVDGFSSLPKHCLTLCYVFFAAAIAINLIRDLAPKKVSRFIPIPMAMAIPFYIGAYFAVDMFVGTAILFVWQRLDRAKADAFAPAVASGMICGDGIWVLPQSVLALAKVNPPICMRFLSRAMNEKVDAFLGN
nr:unnamed protein product [Digitaria exilis]